MAVIKEIKGKSNEKGVDFSTVGGEFVMETAEDTVNCCLSLLTERAKGKAGTGKRTFIHYTLGNLTVLLT